MKRRQFLIASGLGALTVSSPRLVFGSGGSNRDVLLCVFLRGGADGLNLVPPHGEAGYYQQRASIGVPTPGSVGGALDLDGLFGFHPNLAPLAELYQQGDLAVVHAAGSPDPSRSHFDAQDFMERGFPGSDTPVLDGWLNRHLAEQTDEAASPFRAVGFGPSTQLSLRGEVPAVGLARLGGFDLVTPPGEHDTMIETMGRLYAGSDALDTVGQGVLASIDELASTGAAELPVDNGARYPETSFGAQLADVARLIKADAGLEVACVDSVGWDHHDDLVARIGVLGDELARGLHALYTDLGLLMGQVTVITMTEFGRRVAPNASAGTDHGRGSVMMAMGLGVNGGQVYGDWPGLNPSGLDRGDLPVTTDFRSVLGEALQQRHGASNLAGIFPEFTGPTDLGLFAPRL